MGCGQGAAAKRLEKMVGEINKQAPSDPRKLAEDHWQYNEGILQNFDLTQLTQEQLIRLMGYLYRQAMEHGWKHAKES